MKKYSTIDEYIADHSPGEQEIIEKFRTLVKSMAPNIEEAMSYQIPTFKLNGNLVHFAAFKNHYGFYPTPSGITQFSQELSEYETTKGTVKFRKKNPIPWDLVERIVQFRISENQEK